MATPDEIARGFYAAATTVADGDLIRKVVLVVEAAAKRRTPVDTGTLRRSITSRVLTKDRGVVGTNVRYAPFVHEGTRSMRARPFLRHGLDDAQPAIERLLEQVGEAVWSTLS